MPQSLTRTWRVEDENAQKSLRYYDHESALLDILPLSNDARGIRDGLAIPTALPSLQDCRNLVLALPQKDRTAHAFQRTCAGEKIWFSLTKETLLTYYEDRVLHVVGNQRMREWYAAQRLDTSVVGAALAFWENLDGGPLLPDAIVAGLESTLVAEFEAVFLLSYGPFSNTPPHVRLIDASTVDALNLFCVRFYVDFFVLVYFASLSTCPPHPLLFSSLSSSSS